MIVNQVFCPFFDTSTTYAVSSLQSWLPSKIKLWTIWPRAALDLCQYLKLHSGGEVGRFRSTSTAPGLPGAPLTVRSRGMGWHVPPLSVEAQMQTAAALQQSRRFSLRPL